MLNRLSHVCVPRCFCSTFCVQDDIALSHTPLEAFLLLVLFIQTQEMKQLIQKAFLSFLLLIFFF